MNRFIQSRGKERPTFSKKEGMLTGLARCCVGTAFYNFIERKLEGRIEVTERRRKRRKQLIDDVKETECGGNRKRK
jgi:hypothetical protein